MRRRISKPSLRRRALPRRAFYQFRSRLHTTQTHIRTRIRANQPVFYALLATSLALFAVLAWPFTRDHLEAIAVLQEVSGKPVPALIGDIVAHPITREDITLHVESGPIRARMYLPESSLPEAGSPGFDPKAPALVVLHGVHHLGIDEPRLMSFAASMASCGIRVLTPELPDIKDYHVDSTSIRTIGEATEWFAKRTGAPVGVMGLSFSGGLALLAAADPLYKPDFKFVFAVGSQDSMGRVAQYYRTGSDARPNGTIELLPAHEYGPLVLEYEYIEDFVPKPDIPAIRAVLRAHLYEDRPAEAAALARLTPSQKVAADTLMDTASPKTRALIADAMTKHAAEMDGLSPDGQLAHMTTPVYLLHGQADNIIPSAETLWMASQLPSVTLQAMLVSPVISHLDFEGAQPGLWDEWRLIHFFALVMHAIETPGGRTPLL
jgi:pimeloyl-ACP methyl ester carboxylesterase